MSARLLLFSQGRNPAQHLHRPFKALTAAARYLQCTKLGFHVQQERSDLYQKKSTEQ